MPTYEYACKACDHRFDIEQSFYDDALTVCPECSGTLRKVFSAAGIIFKGSGWHVKDYAGSSSSSASASSAEPAKKSTAETPSAKPSTDTSPPTPAATTG